MPGFIFLYRDIANHWVWHDGKLAHRWMDLLIQASWENNTVYFGGSRVNLRRGQLVTTTRLLMSRWRTNARMVLKVLNIFEEEKMIRCKKNKEMTLISVCNFDVYQSPYGPQISPYNALDSPPDFDQIAEHRRNRKRKRNKENNKQENNNKTTQHARDEDMFFNELQSSEAFFEQTAMSLHCETAALKAMLVGFMSECKAKGKEHTDFSDYRNHFFDWARIQIQKNGKRNKPTSGGDTGGGASDRYGARRGTDVGDHTATDYGGSFSV